MYENPPILKLVVDYGLLNSLTKLAKSDSLPQLFG